MKKILTNKQVNQTINKIFELTYEDDHKSIIFGGSFALKLFNLLDRDIYDIDIIVPSYVYYDLLKNLNIIDDKKDNTNNSKNDIPDDINKKDTIPINGVNVDVFISDNSFFTIKQKIFNKELNLLNPFQILSYKYFYLYKNSDLTCDSNTKHTNDIIHTIDKLKQQISNKK